MENQVNTTPGNDAEDMNVNNDQSGAHFSEKDELRPGEGLLHHGRPLSEMEIKELRIHKANNEFLGIADIPEMGTGSGMTGGVAHDDDDMPRTDQLDDRHNPYGLSDEFSSGRDSNFGRNYQAGTQSLKHMIEETRREMEKREEKGKK